MIEMGSEHKSEILKKLEPAFGSARKFGRGNSLYQTSSGTALYVRYSRVHDRQQGFYGLRTSDLHWLQNQDRAVVVFHTDRPEDLVVIPTTVLLELLQFSRAAQDGMYKLQIAFAGVEEMYLPGAGRIGMGAYRGVPLASDPRPEPEVKDATRAHSQMQALLKAIGFAAGNDVWLPRADRCEVVEGTQLGAGCLERLEVVVPAATRPIIENIDVIWLEKGRFVPVAFFEVEHTTSIYSGLLRLNDVLIDYSMPQAAIVTDVDRHATYLRHVRRRTFERSGLADVCSHYTFDEVRQWHARACGR